MQDPWCQMLFFPLFFHFSLSAGAQVVFKLLSSRRTHGLDVLGSQRLWVLRDTSHGIQLPGHGCWARADPQGSEGTGDTSPSPVGNCTGWCCAWGGVPTSNKARLSPPGGDVASGSRIFSWCPTLASSRCASRGAGSRGSCWKSAAPRLLTHLFHENAFQTATKPRKGGRKKGAEQTEIISCCTLCSVGS